MHDALVAESPLGNGAFGRWKAHPRRLVVALLAVSYLIWAGWYLLDGPKSPYGDLSDGVYTDHFSHMNTTRLFARVGLNIYAHPLRDSVLELTPAQRAALPFDLQAASGQAYPVFAMPGGGAAKPFVASWTELPRLHPPGDMLITAPVAILYEFTSLSFSGANHLLILLFLLLGHIALYVVWREGLARRALGAVGLFGLAVIYFEVVQWTLNGFFEPVILVPLIFCARYLRQGRGLEALAAFSVAACIHFRAYFFGPLALYGAWLVIRDRAWRTWRQREWLLAAATVALSAMSLGVFAMVWPAINSVDAHNPIALSAGVPSASTLAIALGIVVLVAVVFAWTRSWLDLTIALWLGATCLLLRQTWPWDVVTLLAWLAFPIASRARVSIVRDARLIGVLGLGTVVFGDATMIAPTWLSHVFG